MYRLGLYILVLGSLLIAGCGDALVNPAPTAHEVDSESVAGKKSRNKPRTADLSLTLRVDNVKTEVSPVVYENVAT